MYIYLKCDIYIYTSNAVTTIVSRVFVKAQHAQALQQILSAPGKDAQRGRPKRVVRRDGQRDNLADRQSASLNSSSDASDSKAVLQIQR
jgi:hypothetical protein